MLEGVSATRIRCRDGMVGAPDLIGLLGELRSRAIDL
jgi:hypothetical protein